MGGPGDGPRCGLCRMTVCCGRCGRSPAQSGHLRCASIHADLVESRVCVGHERVGRLMGEAVLAGIYRRKGPRIVRRHPQVRPVPHLVNRRFTVDAPDGLSLADITYVPTVFLDAFSRRMVGWEEMLWLRHLRQ